MEKGKAPFNDPNLGTTGASCNSCHPNGGTTGGEFSGMKISHLHGVAATFPKYIKTANRIVTLAEMNNLCYEGKDLEAYLHSLK